MRATLLRLRSLPRSTRLGLVAASVAAIVLAVLAQPPIVPGAGQYVFPDQRVFLGVPHALNVFSNLPFALVGWLGWRRAAALAPALRLVARVAFLAIGFVTLGSSLYHLAPGPERLLVDRLPITVAFAALSAWVLGDRLGARWAPRALAALVAFAFWSLWIWFGGGAGDGDLRAYVLTQALPLACIPLLLALFPGALDARGFALAVLFYVVAKLCELFDRQLFEFGRIVSGHTLKHLLSAAACACLVPRRIAGRSARPLAPA